ncbi:unnamed protein product [Acanthoscelides obtectus]|uniref:Uncharacterized protein n=1 Tax=Acanthoscelides obtectus TaxID=200917 RepID=A0A9P0P6R4_ACAOB|nr:unnamed protein product [Acanthoscelides obtectus]CAK1680341.1 hypothetical protein AOBTE_LOCUS32586 [Acanthoscelides obtectus]
MLFLDRSRLSVVFIRKISFFDDSTRLFTPNVNMNERCRPVSRAMQMVLMAKNTPLGDNTVQNTDMDLTIDNHVELGVDTTVPLETSNISDTSRLILENDISALCVMSDEQILEIVMKIFRFWRKKSVMRRKNLTLLRYEKKTIMSRKLKVT